jgi:LacI family transcriptional regulator
MLASLDVKESRDRLRGFKEAHEEAGVEFSEDRLKVIDYQFKAGYQTMKGWVEDEKDVTAIFCASDTIAMGAVLAARDLGKRVPEDYSIVGFDDLSFSEYTYPPLTTIHQPIFQKGKKAAELLINEIEDDEIDHQMLNLDPKLVVRKSCRALKN